MENRITNVTSKPYSIQHVMNVSPSYLKIVRLYLPLCLLVSLLLGCKKDSDTPAPTATSQTELLTANNWKAESITFPDGTLINRNRLNTTTQYLFDLNMQFRSNGRVNALDPQQSNSVINGGTWTLADDFKSINVDVTGFKGNFPIIELSKSKFVIRQKAPVDGKDTDVNLVFVPSI